MMYSSAGNSKEDKNPTETFSNKNLPVFRVPSRRCEQNALDGKSRVMVSRSQGVSGFQLELVNLMGAYMSTALIKIPEDTYSKCCYSTFPPIELGELQESIVPIFSAAALRLIARTQQR